MKDRLGVCASPEGETSSWSNPYLACSGEVHKPVPLCKFGMGEWDDIGNNCCWFSYVTLTAELFFQEKVRATSSNLMSMLLAAVQLAIPSVYMLEMYQGQKKTVAETVISWNQTSWYLMRSWFTAFSSVTINYLFCLSPSNQSGKMPSEWKEVE